MDVHTIESWRGQSRGDTVTLAEALCELYEYANHLGLANPVMRKAHDALARFRAGRAEGEDVR